MLEKYGAHYLSGHDHCQEYSEYKGVSYVLTGVGHGCCYEWTNEVSHKTSCHRLALLVACSGSRTKR